MAGAQASWPTVPADVAAFAPKLAELTQHVLFGDVWQRYPLNPRDRSLVTIAALIASGNTAQLRVHLPLALENGVTRDEISEAMTQLAFYAGWPRVMSAIEVALEVLPTDDPERPAR